MGHYAGMFYDLAVGSLERFSRDVLPRFREEAYEPSLADVGAATPGDRRTSRSAPVLARESRT